MKSLKYALVVLACAVVCATPIQAFADDHGQSNNNPGALKVPDKTPDFPSCWVTPEEIFTGPDDVLAYYVERTEGTPAGILRVRTQDCCISGDMWSSEIITDVPKPKTDFAVGDGSTDDFSGAAYVAPFKYGMVYVGYDSGTDIFPAGMWVEFCYSRERKDELDELIITPVP